MTSVCALLIAGLVSAEPGSPTPYPGAVTELPNVSPEARVVIAQPARMPRRLLRYELARDATGDPIREPWVVLLGEMAFHSPLLLGPRAVFHEVSCQACHPNGGNNTQVEFEESYGVKGRIDLTSPYFSQSADDGLPNPRRIPQLRGVRSTAPYTADGRTAGLKEQVRNVIVLEFGNADPPPYLLDAVVRFVEQLDPLPNPLLDGRGRLTDAAPALAKKGEAFFLAPRPELQGGSCATCHVPDRAFMDGAAHALQGELWNTPSLLGVATTGLYFHDGRARTLPTALTEVERQLGLHLAEAERAALLAYLEAIGDPPHPWETPGLGQQVARAASFIPLLTQSPYRDEPLVWSMTLDTTRRELGALHLEARPPFASVWRELRQALDEAAAAGPGPKPRAALSSAREHLLAVRGGEK